MLELSVLGEVSLRERDVPIRLSNSKTYALLAYLAISPRPVDVADVADLLWPTSPMPKARHSISQLLYALKRKCADDLVKRDADLLSLNRSLLSCDASVFAEKALNEDWKGALEIYGGTFLRGLEIVADDRFEHWRDGISARFQSLHTACVRALAAEAHSASPMDVEAWTKRAFVVDPSPQLAALHFRAVAEQGRLLEAQLGLAEWMKSWGSELEPIDLRCLSGLRESITEARAKAEHIPQQNAPLRFVGRAAEWDSLRAAWLRCARAEIRGIIIGGDAGIGKSRLLAQLAKFAALRGARVEVASGSPLTQQIPYAVASQLFHSFLEKKDPDQPDSSSLRRLLEPSEPLTQSSEDLLRCAYTQAQALVRSNVGDRPVLFVIDDLQWIDDSSLDLLLYLAYRDDAGLVHIGAGVRPEGATRVSQVQAGIPVFVLQLEPFTYSSSQELIAAYCGAAGRPLNKATADDVIRRAEGNPFFLLALADDTGRTPRSVESGWVLPKSITELITVRMRQLNPTAADLLRLLSVLRSAESIETIAEIMEISVLRAARAAEEVVGFRLAGDTGGFLRPGHDLIADAVYELMPHAVRRALHRRVAEVFDTSRAAAVAVHASRGGDNRRAYSAARRAGSEALSVRAYAEAEFYYKLALSSASTRSDRMSAAADYLKLACELESPRMSMEYLPLAKEHFTAVNDEIGLLRCAAVEIDFSLRHGTTPLKEAAVAADTLLARAEHVGDRRLIAEISAVSARIAELGGDSSAIARWVDRAVHIAEDADTDWKVSLIGKAAVLSYFARGASAADQLSSELLGDAGDDPRLRALALAYRGACLMLSGALYEAETTFLESLELCKDPILADTYIKASWNLAVLEIDLGRFADAYKRLTAPAFGPYGLSGGTTLVTIANIGYWGLESGDLAAVDWAVVELKERGRTIDAPTVHLAAAALAGLAAWQRSDYDRSRAEAFALEPLMGRLSLLSDDSYCLVLLGRVRAMDDPQSALQLLTTAAATLRPVVPQLRVELERALLLHTLDSEAGAAALQSVYERATAIGARPIADRAAAPLSLLA